MFLVNYEFRRLRDILIKKYAKAISRPNIQPAGILNLKSLSPLYCRFLLLMLEVPEKKK